ncbi:MAG: sulfite exporter TauE/SafE family protein [Verrucomicrobia bacterium]|nr:sulfite exporter TauE/SafE family protein [Cytophagales bacterium]
MQQFLVYLMALLMGVVLGITGGGGSILTVPVLVYLAGVGVVTATGYSLFIVGVTAFAGTLSYIRQGFVNFRAALVFALPSVVAVFFMRKVVVPLIPQKLFCFGNLLITKDLVLMAAFVLLMLITAVSMLSTIKKEETIQTNTIFHFRLIATQGFSVGILTGLLGAGGGFIIVPALVLLANLPIRFAVGTSLLVITINALVGFLGDFLNASQTDWQLLLSFSGVGILGVFVGSYFSKFIAAPKLKAGFGYFLLVMAAYIIVNEVKKLFNS